MRTILLLWAVVGMTAPVLRAADIKALDVKFYDPKTKKDDILRDVTIVEESPAGIQIKQRTGPPRAISALDIREINYVSEKVPALDWRKPFGIEARALLPTTRDQDRPALFENALKEYEALVPKLADEKPAKRFIEYRSAQVRTNWSRYDVTQTDAAIKALAKFKEEHREGWEIAPALRTLAELQRDKGDYKDAEQTYTALAAVPGLTNEIRWECDLSLADLMLQSDRANEAQAKYKALSGNLPRDHPYADRVEVGLLRCQLASGQAAAAEQGLRTMLTKARDNTLRALVHNTLGDYYLKANRPEDAFWEYLRVDVQYNEDKNQHARALYHLAKLFATLKKNPDRADQCKEALLKDKRFEGTEYQKRAQQEK